MKKVLIVLLGIALAIGCSEENSNLTPSINDSKNVRLTFKDVNAFFAMSETLGKMTETELETWRSGHSFPSMEKHLESLYQRGADLNIEEEEFSKFPSSYLMMLNKDGEVRIGNTIVWYNQGTKHFASSEDELKAIKANPLISKVKQQYALMPVEPASERAGARTTTDVGMGGNVNLQTNFDWCNMVGNLRKHIFELYALQDGGQGFPGGYTYHTILYFRIRMEYRSSGTWKTAGDWRWIRYNITVNATVVNGSNQSVVPQFIVTSNLYPDYMNRNSGISENLIEGTFNYTYGTVGPKYVVTVTGTIGQAITDQIPSASGGGQCNLWEVTGTIW